MNPVLSPEEALRMIPELSDKRFRWQELEGGFTNRSFKVDTTDRIYVLRLDGVYTEAFGLDRDVEARARDIACSVGIAAPLVFADKESGIFLSEFLPGEVWDERSLDDRKNLIALANLICEVHALPSLGVDFDANAVAERYASKIVENSELREPAQELVERISSMPVAETNRCCHNDVIAANVIEHGSLKLLDWEYACDNDPMFDLASVIVYHNLDAGQVGTLLSAYAGGSSPDLREQLEIQIRMYEAIQWLWFAARNEPVS